MNETELGLVHELSEDESVRKAVRHTIAHDDFFETWRDKLRKKRTEGDRG